MGDSFDIGSVVAKVTADISGFKAGIDQAKQEASGFGDHLSNIAENVRHFAEGAALVVEAQTVVFEELGRRVIEVAANFEQTQTSFGTLLGSEQKAADLMKEIMGFEQHTPFDISTLTEGAKSLLAFGIASDQVVPKLKEFTDMSQGQTDKLKELISIYGEVNSIQQLNGREVLRLTSIGIPIYQALEDHFKKMGDGANYSGEEIKKMISKGQIGVKDFDAVMSELTSKGGLYFNENIRQMGTFNGIISSTKSQFEYAILNIMGIDIGAANEVKKGGLFDTIRGLAARLLDFLHQLQPVLAQLGSNKLFQYAVEGMVVALASLAIILPIVVVLFNPLILVVLAIEALIVLLFIAWNTNFLGIRDITNRVITEVMHFFNDYLKPLIKEFATFWKEIWPELSVILKLNWDYMSAIIKLAWDIIYGIIKIALDLLTGNWKKAWQDIVALNVNAFNDVMNVLRTGLAAISRWGGDLVHELVSPFEAAWDKISGLMNKIKDGLDFTKRHSPSVLDIVQNGVQLVNGALQGITYTPNISADQIAGNILTPFNQSALPGIGSANNPSITIQLPNAIISDQAGATRIAELIGNQLINRLKQNVRF